MCVYIYIYIYIYIHIYISYICIYILKLDDFFLNFQQIFSRCLEQFDSNGKLFLDNIATIVHNVFFACYFSQHCQTHTLRHIGPHLIHHKHKMFQICTILTVFLLLFSLFHNLLNFHQCLHFVLAHNLNCSVNKMLNKCLYFLQFYAVSFILCKVEHRVGHQYPVSSKNSKSWCASGTGMYSGKLLYCSSL